MTAYKLKTVHPLTVDLSELTHKQRLVLPWEVVEATPTDVTVASGDRYYKAVFYMLGDEGLSLTVGRHYCDRTPKTVYTDPVAEIPHLPKNSLARRLAALAQQYPVQRLSEIVHATTGLHSDFCLEGCSMGGTVHVPAVPGPLPQGWTSHHQTHIPEGDDILSKYLRDEAVGRTQRVLP